MSRMIWLNICWLALTAHGQTIALDVGHTHAHPGATSARGVNEFSYNQELALVVQQVLQARGFKLHLIGEQGDMSDLRARTRAAAGADFFLSLHHDSVQPQYLQDWQVDGQRHHYSDRFSGFSLFVSRTNPALTKSLACASTIGATLRQAGFHSSAHHAEPIAGENRAFADAANGVYYFDDLVVLKTATMPAVLLEAGIIVNRTDELSLQEPTTRERIAAAIADGLQRCFQ